MSSNLPWRFGSATGTGFAATSAMAEAASARRSVDFMLTFVLKLLNEVHFWSDGWTCLFYVLY